MRSSIRAAFLFALVLLVPGLARATIIMSAPVSNAAGFSSVVCHLVNATAKDLVVQKFWIYPVTATASYGVASSGVCTGAGPWTVGAGKGCGRSFNYLPACNQPDGCYCVAEISGSAKGVRAALSATVNGSNAAVISELK